MFTPLSFNFSVQNLNQKHKEIEMSLYQLQDILCHHPKTALSPVLPPSPRA